VTLQPAQIFEEQQQVEEDDNDSEEEEGRFVTRIVQRKPEWSDNTILPTIHDQLVGEAIYNYLIQVFGNTSSAIPYLDVSSTNNALSSKVSNVQLLEMIQQVANLFVISGFAWDRQVTSNTNKSTTSFQICLISPATLWSGQVLQQNKSYPTNDFIRKTLQVLFTKIGKTVLEWKVEYKDNQQEITTFVIST